MSNEKFKDKHPGVPKNWKQLGQGGNAYVWFDGENAIKRLRQETSSTIHTRFRREAELLLALQQEDGLRIVEVIEVRERENALEIVMEKLDGTLRDNIAEFRGDAVRAAKALEPIARTLACLYALSEPIYHRDLKPSNLLFKDSVDQLYLGDFGCAFIDDDSRLTPSGVAIGARQFRPPEYENGRVENVSEKGDVFSLGKVFWSMIYGEKGVTFPSSLWHLQEYDLATAFPDAGQINEAMLIIAKAAESDPSKRPSMSDLADMFSNLGPSNASDEESVVQVARIRRQNQIEIRYNQRRIAASKFVQVIHGDFRRAVFQLFEQSPDDALWRTWNEEASKPVFNVKRLIHQVAENESDAPLMNVRYRGIVMISRFWPALSSAPLRMIVGITAPEMGFSSSLAVYDRESGISFEQSIGDVPPRQIGKGGKRENEQPYKSSTLQRYFLDATNRIFELDS